MLKATELVGCVVCELDLNKTAKEQFGVRSQVARGSGCKSFPLIGGSAWTRCREAPRRLDMPCFWVLMTQMCSICENSTSCTHRTKHPVLCTCTRFSVGKNLMRGLKNHYTLV